jgi:sulfite exporter TauE/SafE
MALIGAMALASAPEGALYMVLFGLGTAPLMTAAALMGKLARGKWGPALRKAIPVFVVIIGLLFVLRGMGLGIPYLSPAAQAPESGQAATETVIGCHPE